LPRHSHENPGFFFLLSGDHFERSDRRAKVQPETSLMFHGHDSPHEDEVGPRGMTGLNIAFERRWLAESDIPELRHRDGWLLEKPRAKADALRLLAGLSKAPQSDIENLGVELIEMLHICQGPADKVAPRWLIKVRDRIESDYMQPISLTSLAQEVSVHPVYLARTFRKRYGCSLTSYLQQVRVLQAIARVSLGMSIGEAAVECGFCDQSYLARIVRSKLGVTPTALNWFQSSKAATALAQ
jgi:AraC family transcriptional regulator